MNGNQLLETAKKVIGIKKLRQEVPTIKSKQKEDFINYLYKNNKNRLEWLVDCCTQLKKRNVYFSYSKSILDFKKIEGERIKDDSSDLIFEFKRVTLGDDIAAVSVTAHSAVHEYKNVEEPVNLTPFDVRFRIKFTINFIYHLKDSIIECRSRSLKKFEILKGLIEKKFNLKKDSIVLIKVKEDEYKKIDETRYKSLTVSGLNIAGANKISIDGDDVEQTLKFFESKNIDLRKCSKNWCLKKVVTNQKSITFFDDGKITYRPLINDIYEELKGVLLEHANQIKKG